MTRKKGFCLGVACFAFVAAAAYGAATVEVTLADGVIGATSTEGLTKVETPDGGVLVNLESGKQLQLKKEADGLSAKSLKGTITITYQGTTIVLPEGCKAVIKVVDGKVKVDADGANPGAITVDGQTVSPGSAFTPGAPVTPTKKPAAAKTESAEKGTVDPDDATKEIDQLVGRPAEDTDGSKKKR